MKSFHLFFIFILFWAITMPNDISAQKVISLSSTPTHPIKGSEAEKNKTGKNKFVTYQIIPSNGTTYGYDIFIDSKLKIHQTTIPGRAGVNGFKTETDAKKVAELAVNKIISGQMPPTISQKEIEKLLINLK
ncbi:MAG: DUF4907 domain-containing protein [Saprospiraceae bacterium]